MLLWWPTVSVTTVSQHYAHHVTTVSNHWNMWAKCVVTRKVWNDGNEDDREDHSKMFVMSQSGFLCQPLIVRLVTVHVVTAFACPILTIKWQLWFTFVDDHYVFRGQWAVECVDVDRTLAPADSPVSDCLRGRDQTKCDPLVLQVTGGLGNGLIILSHKRKLLGKWGWCSKEAKERQSYVDLGPKLQGRSQPDNWTPLTK